MQNFKYFVSTLVLGATLVGCMTISDETSEVVEQSSVESTRPSIQPTLPPPVYPPPSYPRHPSIPPSDPNRSPLEQCLSCHPNGYPGPPRPNDPHWPNYPNKRGKKFPPGQDPGDPMCLSCHTEPPDADTADAEALPSLDP